MKLRGTNLLTHQPFSILMLYLLRTYHYALFAPYLELHLKDPNLWTFLDILANVQLTWLSL